MGLNQDREVEIALLYSCSKKEPAPAHIGAVKHERKLDNNRNAKQLVLPFRLNKSAGNAAKISIIHMDGIASVNGNWTGKRTRENHLSRL